MAKRNAAGGGSIRQRSDGRWEGRYSYRDDLGQPKRGSIYGRTQREVRRDIDAGQFRETRRYTVAQWLEEWLSVHCARLKPMTISTYRTKIENWVLPYISDVPIAALTPLTVQRYYATVRAKSTGEPLSAKSLASFHGLLHKAFRQATVSGLLPTNPFADVELPRVQRPDLHPLMDDDVRRFLEAIKGDRLEPLFTLILFSGLRISEAIALHWEDVDLDAGLIVVHRQIQKDPGGGYFFTDSTKSGRPRTVTIPASICTVLRRHKAQQGEWRLAAGPLWEDSGLVFTDERGSFLKHSTVRHHFKKIVSSIALPHVRIHDLRHSYAIAALQAGDSVRVIQEQLGHSSPTTTMSTYMEISSELRKASQERMEAFFQEVKSSKG